MTVKRLLRKFSFPKMTIRLIAVPAGILAVAALTVVAGVAVKNMIMPSEPPADATSLAKSAASLTIEPPSLLLRSGDKETLTAAPAAGVRWKSENSKVARVDPDGEITALNIGNTIVTATGKDGATASCVIIVRADIVLGADSGIALKETAKTIPNGTKRQLSATVARKEELAWISDNPKVAGVDHVTGVVTAASPGQAKVTAVTRDGATASCDITVVAVEIVGGEISLGKGQTKTLGATVLPGVASEAMTWKSSNPKVAEVDQNTGVVTARSQGSAKIKVSTKVDGIPITDECLITVTAS